MNKHTPGPWIVGKPFKDTAQIPIIKRIIATDVDTGFGIALVTDHRGASYCPDTKANARLIAAAPELYAALKATAEYLIASNSECFDPNCECEGNDDSKRLAKMISDITNKIENKE